jgi:hypothetical protein
MSGWAQEVKIVRAVVSTESRSSGAEADTDASRFAASVWPLWRRERVSWPAARSKSNSQPPMSTMVLPVSAAAIMSGPKRFSAFLFQKSMSAPACTTEEEVR